MENKVSFDDLTVLLAVLRDGGFRAAARRLGVAPSKVSTTISRIEAQLGVPVLRRTTRSLHLTDAGKLLVDRVTPLLSAVDAACLEVANLGGQVQGRLTLNVPGAVMPDILPPLLAEYRLQHPGVEVEIMVENDLVDVVAAGCDAGIRYGSVLEQDMISIPIGPRTQQMALAAAPAYLQEHGMPLKPEDLTAHSAIRYRLKDGPLLPWTLCREGQFMEVKPNNALILSVNAIDTGLRYTRAGMGIIQTFRNWLDEDFANGRLVPVLPDWWPEMDGPRLYYPNRSAPQPLRSFIEICRSAV
ncbi:DNA-binding transcriptional regulator, LysR family [Cohaesibacter sp. ES.047]|uniref:LysR family transcriptional regulator n=1 Tax=Cohaesibacter sp. ES.047 TaxID=1798205 RepID=UPI000BB9193C|nr:LysR family transcriptional regulator [Cohaesibacter sp. ES.047]SNY90420.1 DNA-binding transcriptional regulator, LysR family [Cohaesibacter sp. ES.047]